MTSSFESTSTMTALPDKNKEAPIYGVPPSRQTSPISFQTPPGAHEHRTPEYTGAGNGAPMPRRTITGESRLSRIASSLPNPEGDVARGRKPPPPPSGLKKYHYSFFSPEMKGMRAIAVKILMGVVVLTTVVMWLCAPVYWGSLWKANKYIDKLTVRVIDRDGGPIGQEVSQALLSLTGSRTQLKYFYTSPSEFPTIDDINHDIVEEGAWASIVINQGASAALEAARQHGDANYKGQSAISLIYAQARQETAIGTYLLPSAQAALIQITAKMSALSVAQYLQTNAGNATAMNLLAQAPGTVAEPISYSLVNLRPYNQPVATAITLVGLIYMLIFAFIQCMGNNGVREIIAPYLTTGAYIRYRIFSPLVLYLPISFFFALINLPFKIQFGAHFTYAGGFFLWWWVLYLGMASVGLATEFLITFLGPKFMGFTLIPLIIANVSVVSLPHELQPWIFRYGVAMPFYNCSRAVRTIIFNTKNDIGMNCGILLAWIAVSLITMPLATWLMRRNAINEHRKEMGEMELDKTLPDGRVV